MCQLPATPRPCFGSAGQHAQQPRPQKAGPSAHTHCRQCAAHADSQQRPQSGSFDCPAWHSLALQHPRLHCVCNALPIQLVEVLQQHKCDPAGGQPGVTVWEARWESGAPRGPRSRSAQEGTELWMVGAGKQARVGKGQLAASRCTGRAGRGGKAGKGRAGGWPLINSCMQSHSAGTA